MWNEIILPQCCGCEDPSGGNISAALNDPARRDRLRAEIQRAAGWKVEEMSEVEVSTWALVVLRPHPGVFSYHFIGSSSFLILLANSNEPAQGPGNWLRLGAISPARCSGT